MATGRGRVRDEDTVYYRLFLCVPKDQNVGTYLEERRDTYLAFLGCFNVNYIWQQDPFNLRLHTASTPAHLFGSTCYGDNVDDEWFIVFLLKELCKKFTELVISVCDSDGEFLLIEAADDLPKWLNPETAENRVFLHGGQLHIIPRTELSTGRSAGEPPSVSDAVDYVRSNPTITIATDRIQRAIQQRISGYPRKSRESIHHAHCYIPAVLAAILDQSPALIAPIVQAFYHRDALDLKACVTFRHFRPGTRITRRVTFTRCLYAQLMHQSFTPDKRSGYTLPPPTNAQFKAHDLGIKLAHGAEILCSRCSNVAPKPASETDDVSTDTRWRHFLAALTDKGYFKGELQGSKLYNRLLTDAQHYYKSIVVSATSDRCASADEEAGVKLMTSLQTVQFDVEQMRRQEKDLLPADDDAWINVSADQLDRMLSNMSGRPSTKITDLNQLADNMKSFVNKVSSHEGVEVPGADDEMQFDPNSFMQTMQKMFEFDDANSASSSDMDEYESEDELGDMFCSPRNHKRKSAAVKTTAAASQSKTKSASVDSGKPRPVRPPKPTVPSKPSVAAKPSAMASSGLAGNSKSSSSTCRQSDVKTKSHSTRQVPAASAAAPARDDDVGSFLGMKEYMDAMDRELAKTTVGKSFVREGDEERAAARPKPPPRRRKPQAKSTSESRNAAAATGVDDIDDEDDDFRPVNVDMNAVKNLLHSYEAEHGHAGPTSNILGGMGVHLPPAPPSGDF